jgi:hypothetical protein
VSQEPEHDST